MVEILTEIPRASSGPGKPIVVIECKHVFLILFEILEEGVKRKEERRGEEEYKEDIG